MQLLLILSTLTLTITTTVVTGFAVPSNTNSFDEALTSRFPTSPDDQVRQAALSLQLAKRDGKTRHDIRLLLPVIGATELDDWPGGARQMMEAASPLVQNLMTLSTETSINTETNENEETENKAPTKVSINESVIDPSDGLRALFCQAPKASEDSCALLLPSADNYQLVKKMDQEVGQNRNLVMVNSQWRRKTDFGVAFFGGRDEKVSFVETFAPTYYCSNVMVDGDICRVLRMYPGDWRVYLRDMEDPNDPMSSVDWIMIGSKPLLESKTAQWEIDAKEDGGDIDGGKIFDYGKPTYNEIQEMIVSREGYVPKSISERAASAFNFIKDTL